LHQKFRFGRSAKKNASAFEFFKRKTPQHLNFSKKKRLSIWNFQKKNASAFEIWNFYIYKCNANANVYIFSFFHSIFTTPHSKNLMHHKRICFINRESNQWTKSNANSNKFHLTFSPPHVNSRISNFFSKTIQHRMQHLFRDYSND